MNIGERIHLFREQRQLSQGDVEHTTGMLRCYISRVEHGHTVPSVATLERFAKALDVPLYRLFANTDVCPTLAKTRNLSLEEQADEPGAVGHEARFLLKVRDLTANMSEENRTFLLEFAGKLSLLNAPATESRH